MSGTTNRAVGYTRVSTVGQADEGVSLEAQRDRIELYARAAGLELVEVIVDAGVSGSVTLDQRDGGARLLELARKGHHIVALKLDRLFRDASDALAVTRNWDRAGVALHLVDLGGQAVNTGSAMGRMMLTMMAGFAELERGLIAERTAAALAHKRDRRETYNHAPLGFRDEDGRLVPVEGEMQLVGRIQALRLKGMSLRRIADRLNAEGVQGKRAGRFHASTIRAVLANPLHARAQAT